MISELHLIEVGLLSITAASLVYVFLVESNKDDSMGLIGLSRSIIIKLSPPAIFLLLMASLVALAGIGFNNYFYGDFLNSALGIDLAAIAILFCLGIYILRTMFVMTKFIQSSYFIEGIKNQILRLNQQTNRETNKAKRQTRRIPGLFYIIWLLPSLIYLFIYISMSLVSGKFSLLSSMFLLAFAIGNIYCLLFPLRFYIFYGFSNYQEAFSPDEWYIKLVDFVENSKKYYITVATPAFILPTEFDPVKYPLVGASRHPARKKVFEKYFELADSGLEILYLIDLSETKKFITEHYNKPEIFKKYREASLNIFSDVIQNHRNITIKYYDKNEKDLKTLEHFLITDIGIIRTEQDSFDIKYGQFIRDKLKSMQYLKLFHTLWSGNPTANNFDDIAKDFDMIAFYNLWDSCDPT